MFKREIRPLSEAMTEAISKSINKIEYVEEKASRDADRTEGDVKAKDINNEEPVKSDGSATKAPARKGDQPGAEPMQKVKEEVELNEVSKKTLGSYMKKAVADKNSEYDKAEKEKNDDKAMLHLAKARKRVKGVDMAHKKMKEELNPVSKDAKGKFANRKDKDIDNDGDVDSADKYLHKRRKAISKAIAKEEVELDEGYRLVMKTKDGETMRSKVYSDKKEAESAKWDAIQKNKKQPSNRQYKSIDIVKEEVELDEARNYEIKDGKIHISKANFRKVHKDYKNATKGQERMMALDPKGGGTTSFPVVFTEEVELGEAKKSDLMKQLDKDFPKFKAGKIADVNEVAKFLEKHGFSNKGAMNAALDFENFKKGTFKESLELDEAKSSTGYTINHKTFSSAVQHAKAQVEKKGYTIDDDEWDRKVAMGPKKPGTGKTNRYTIDLMKNGKETPRKLQMQVYYDEGRYELNMYIS